MRLPFGRGRGTPAATGLPPTRGLFVIGTARGGTTILQNALNESRDVVLLGEPDVHLEQDEPGFAARFNAMHRGWANQPTKSSYLPPLLAEDGPWDAHFDRLGAHYRWVGTKIVLNPDKTADWMDRFRRFQYGRFHDARYLFVFREPAAVLASTLEFQRMSGAPSPAAAILANYAQAVALFTELVRTLPSVRAIVHEDIDARVFDALAAWLDTAFDGAAGYYDAGRVHRHAPPPLSADEAHGLELLQGVFGDLRAAIGGGLDRLQLEQNSRNPDPGHLTAIGSIHARVDLIDRFLRGER